MSLQSEAALELHGFLSNKGIPYILIGGFAVQFWGEPRFTQDIDVTVLLPPDNPVAAIKEITDRFPPRIEDAVAFAKRNRVILVRASNGCPMDISLGIPGYEEEAIERAAEIELAAGERVRICSAEDLIIHKAVAGRGQDNRDIEGVILRQDKRLDIRCIRHWLAVFSEILESSEVQARFEIPWGRLSGRKT